MVPPTHEELARIGFGPLAAQDDPALLDYFHSTAQSRRLVEPTRLGHSDFIVVSRPGAGKTALMKWLSHQADDLPALVIRGSQTRLMPPDDAFNVDDYRLLAWSELATACVLEGRRTFDLSGEAAEASRNFRRRRGWQQVKRFLANVRGIEILGVGASMDPGTRREYVSILRQSEIQQDLEKTLKKIAADVEPVLAIDDPEFMIAEGLDELSSGNAIRLGALLSALGRLNSLGIGVVVFIKEHLFVGVTEAYNDSRHFEDRVQRLEWTAEDLLGVIRLRINHRMETRWERIFSLSEDELSELVLPQLTNGPRDLLEVCNLALRSGLPIGNEALKNALAQLAGKWRRELKKQFNRSWPEFAIFAHECVTLFRENLDPDNMSLDEMKRVVEDGLIAASEPLGRLRSKNEWVDRLVFDLRRAVELLFAAGCLGLHEGSDRVYPWAGRSLERFASADSYFVSPAVP